MPVSNVYGTSTDIESDTDSLPPMNPSGQYVDPWDLENYAYLREHLDSSDLPSDPASLTDFVEAHSSFDYVPSPIKTQQGTMTTSRYDSVVTDQGTYACIDELGYYEKSRPQSDIYGITRRCFPSGRYSDVRIPVYSHTGSMIYHQTKNNKYRKNIAPTFNRKYNNHRDRSISFAYGDGNEIYGYRQSIYSRPIEKIMDEEIYYPIYDDPRSIRKPNNFGLSNYGHLKIDYSYSWNNLDKYIVG